MNKELIEEAKKCLQIVDVHLGNLEIKSNDAYDFAFVDHGEVAFQLKHHILGEVREFDASPKGQEADASSSQKFVRFDFMAAYRVVTVSGEAQSETQKAEKTEVDESKVVAEVKAIFRAYYRIVEAVTSRDSLIEFAKYNVGYHVWPYWRELASSSASRLRLPPVTIPVYILPK